MTSQGTNDEAKKSIFVEKVNCLVFFTREEFLVVDLKITQV